ncbi:MAG: LPS assembly lipoprotein LptE [Candidatus Bathyarchaeia archaeon]
MNTDLLRVLLIFGVVLLIGAALVSSESVKEPPHQVVLPIVEANVAVMPFEDLTYSGRLGRDLRARVEAALARRPGITVFSRTSLDVILQEQKLGALGLIEPTTALEIGRLTGVNKIITGSVLGAHVHAEAGWAGLIAALISTLLNIQVTASQLRATVTVQFQIIDAQTGRVEVAETVSEEDYIVLERNRGQDEASVAISRALDRIADTIANRVQGQYTEEIRYGLYKDVKRLAKGLEGVQPTTTFSRSDGQAVLLVFMKRVRPGSTFYVQWRGPDGTVFDAPKQLASEGAWIPFVLPLLTCTPGNWTVALFYNDRLIATCNFLVY